MLTPCLLRFENSFFLLILYFAALQDLDIYLASDEGRVVIFDATNSADLIYTPCTLQAALQDLDIYLASDEGQVVIFDATNSTEERRRKLVRVLGFLENPLYTST